MKRHAGFAWLCLCFIAGAVTAQTTKVEKIQAYMVRAYELGLFKGNVLVADDGKVLYEAAMGFTDASEKTPLTTQYRFHIGSIAKEFDAVALMMLKDQGKLSLDDKVSKYLPQLPAWANTVTIKNLLQYTSGIPDVKWKTVKTDADNMADLMQLKSLDFEPGSKYAYNNNNVFLRRRIIEAITGMPFNQFVQQKILTPSGMSNSVVDPGAEVPLMARGYDKNFQPDAITIPISGWTAVTLDDFYKWAQAIANFKLITPQSTRDILIPIAPGKQSGLGGGNMDGDKLINHSHDGTAYDYQALLVSDPPKGRTVILLTNNKNVSLYQFNGAIQAILDDQPYAKPAKSISISFQNKLDSLTGDQFIAFYNDLKKTHADEYGFDDENTLNEIGYYFLGKNKMADAIIVFEYNTKLFPNSWNVFDSLGEAYADKGDKQNALLNYKKSVQLNPNSQSGKDIIKKLEQPGN
ncbi:serine hydrolase [Mucilaginibacter sp. X4EP1]|uniref:serine hydrolase domain-containing protein n=1 Tax=Mucilaginibacter sp. X4EP1 TaxID=2723092 RepID=UPI002167294F|nr:serine hydrolase domain-containing protein [Mucilaginibacter sp. X4EP1]MCS3814343.1 CubicO group peptidase (beta-lactamase class C family) [Mucilaginibacter sp. X4EP1]